MRRCFLIEIRSAGGDPQQQRDERIDCKIDRRRFAGQTVAGRGVVPQGELPPKIVQGLLRSAARRETPADLGERGIGLARHPPLDRALARVVSEKGRVQRPTILNILDNRRRFGQREIVVGQHRRAAARIERAEFRSLQVAGIEQKGLAMIKNSLVFEREPDPPGVERARAVREADRQSIRL